MTNLKRRIISAAAAGVVALNVVTPALATEIVISENGANSDNYVTVNSTNTTSVNQTNNAIVTNKAETDADTGGNKANYNTGGNVGIQTGDAEVKVNVSNALNSNQAEVNCCAAAGTDVKISGNAAKSDNTVKLDNTNTNVIGQTNKARVDNDVEVDSNTGHNKAGSNTGGDVVILTGNAKTDVNVSTTANVNSARIGNGYSAMPTPSASFMILDNGAGTNNFIQAGLTNTNTVKQANTADVDNEVEVDTETGDNEANFNTGGDVVIMTGNAKAKVNVDNAVNFNAADIDCGCEFDVLAKIAGNGGSEDSRHHHHRKNKDQNVITLDLINSQLVGQGNNANLKNNVDVDEAETGDNEASSNTGAVDHASDPAIVTGDAYAETNVSNSGNMNVLGNLPFSMPEMPQVDFSFNMAFLWAMFGMSL